MKKIFFIVAGVVVAGLTACAGGMRSRNLGDPSVDGKTLAQQVCSTCHGVDGNSISPQYPKLAGQNENYLKQQLENFESHIRTDRLAIEIMAGMSASLTTQQITQIAHYYSTQSLVNAGAHPSTRQNDGQAIFANGIADRGIAPCAACHGGDAKGTQDFPRLAGQHKEYLVKQLHVFRDTSGRPNTVMQSVVEKLSEREIDQLAGYLASLD